jgi:HD-GYP domain-containing protein (c-di-GMP phosphodiesterase class II)
MKMSAQSDTSSALAERLLDEGRISPALASAALERHRTSGDRFEEALIDCGLPESMLLRHLAEMFNTRFISTKTLSGVLVPRTALSRLPRRLAERYQVLPIRFADDDVLTVVAAEPGNSELLENVRVAAGARLVTGLVARPAAINAAIAKLYGGENEAFTYILTRESGVEPVQSSGSYQNGSGFQNSADGMQGGEMLQSGIDAIQNGAASSSGNEEPFADVQLDTSAFDGPSAYAQQQAQQQPAYDQQQYESSAYGASPASEASAAFEPPSYEPRPSEPLLPEPPPAPAVSGPNGSWVPSSDPTPELDAGIARARSLALGDASTLAESLMIIHERTRGSLKSHSVRVARLSYSLCRQLDLSEVQAAQAWAIGLFHDLGKSQQNHLTALNVWQLEDYEVTARAQFKNPGRLLKNADVPDTVLTAILHMYERFDGKGFPDGLAEEAIPFQSRVVALCDSVADLTLNPANTLGRIVSPLEACNHIRAQTPKVFDPTLLAHFSRLLVERKLDGAFLSDQSVHGIEKLLG